MPGRCWYPLAWNVSHRPYWCCSFRQSIIRHAIATLARSDPVFPFAAVLSSLYDHTYCYIVGCLLKKRFTFLDNIANTPFQKEAGRRWIWRSLSGNTKHEINITIDTTSMVTVVTVINRVNIGSDHRMLLGSVTLA